MLTSCQKKQKQNIPRPAELSNSSMGPFQEYQVKKPSGKGSCGSRIPRLVLQPTRPEGPSVSGEESNRCDISAEHSKRTISPNSFSSDDTGCPSSQCASPGKTASGSGTSPLGSPPAGDRKVKVKRVRVKTTTEWNTPTQKDKREQHHHSILHIASEADFSSSSSTGSFKTHEILANSSTGKKSCSPRSRVNHIKSQPVFKPPGSPIYTCRTPPQTPLSSTICSYSSPTSRRTTSRRYHSCGDNHGINPPNPEQYLTPLQQKEVTIRHLKTKLRDSEQTVHARESEIQELNSQLGRMREDWIEEECHRVEAQLALKEARKEIKQLRQVVETMKNSLMEKDKGIQKYFIDINIQNRKLESLLHSMELAQSGASLHDEPTLDFIGHSPKGPMQKKMEEELQVDDQVEEEMADSGLPVHNELANQMDKLEKVLMSTALESLQDCKHMDQPGPSTMEHNPSEDTEKSTEGQISSEASAEEEHEEKAVQTEEVFSSLDLQALLLQLLKFQNTGLSNMMSTPSKKTLQRLPKAQEANMPQDEEAIKNEALPQLLVPKLEEGISQILPPAMMVIPEDPGGSNQSCLMAEMDPTFTEELDLDEKDTSSSDDMAVVVKNHWSNNFLIDLVAVAAPVLPTLAWLYSQHGVVGGHQSTTLQR